MKNYVLPHKKSRRIAFALFSFALITSSIQAQNWWIKFGTSMSYSSFNLDDAGLGQDFQKLTGHSNFSFSGAGNQAGYGAFGADIGGKHFFVGFNWIFDLQPYDYEQNYYEQINTNTFYVPDNISVNARKEQLEGRLGFGRFASSESGTPSFFGIGGFIFAGTYNQSIELNNYTTRDLYYKDIRIKNGSLFNNFETTRLVCGVGFITFITFGEGSTSFGFDIELRYSHICAGSWKDASGSPVSLSQNGFNMFSILFSPRVRYNDYDDL